MKISVYMETIAYKYGGAECYTANLIETLQEIYPRAHILLITEHLAGRRKIPIAEIIEMQNKAYGTSIAGRNIDAAYFSFTKVDERKTPHKIGRLCTIIIKELLAIKQWHDIRRLSEGSDIFINASFKIIAGRAGANICIVHFPLSHASGLGINIRLPFFRGQARERDEYYRNGYLLYLPNSHFTACHLREMWQVPEQRVRVLHPPVRMVACGKEKVPGRILVCSRITRDKKIAPLVEAFSSSEFLSKNAGLVVAGSVKGEDPVFVERLREAAPGNVRFVFEPDREELESLYASSCIFWHAMGYGEDEPMKSEHFGITTVEAMSAGCVPVVINKGGQREIVTEGCGFRWDTLDELVERTEFLIKNPDAAERLRKNCIERSRLFSKEEFARKFKDIMAGIVPEPASGAADA